MLYNTNWLLPGSSFPPKTEVDRLDEYKRNAEIFDLTAFKEFENLLKTSIANYDEYIKFPSLLSYQRLQTIKIADMVCGAVPSISNKDDALADTIQDIRDTVGFDDKLYSAVVDFSRFGVFVIRIFKRLEDNKFDFTGWNPCEWFPVLYDDGTNRVKEHVLAWKENKGTESNPIWRLRVQRHPIKGGFYFEELYGMNSVGDTIEKQISSTQINTDEAPCLVQYAASIATSTNIYGTSDYKVINTLIVKATERLLQILHILDAHASPSMKGPSCLLETTTRGEKVFNIRQYYAYDTPDVPLEYVTWDGQLESAFKAFETLMQQIYILSEMGDAFLGIAAQTGTAISGTAMRFKMASPLTKARRITNTLTLPVKKLISTLLKLNEAKDIKYQDIDVTWEDSLPKDPREQAELARLKSGMVQIQPLKVILTEMYGLSSDEANKWLEAIEAEQKRFGAKDNGTEPNPAKKGSSQSLTAGGEGSTGTKSRTK